MTTNTTPTPAQPETPEMNDAEQWKHDLTAAGWVAESSTAWRAPDGSLWRGPYGAWKELQRRTQEQKPALSPCPFCGSTNLSEPYAQEGREAHVSCNACGAVGPSNALPYGRVNDKHFELGRTLWNTRAAVAEPRGVIELLSASLLHPESAEGYVRQAIEMLSTAAPSVADAIQEVRDMQRDWEREARNSAWWQRYVDAATYIISRLESLAPPERTQVTGEQDVKLRIESIAEPWICVEEKPCEEAVPVHWNEMITALVAAEQRSK